MTVWSGLVVPVPLFALSLLVDGPEAVANGLRHIDAVTIGSTLYTAYLCSLFGYGVWNTLLCRYPTAERGPVHPARPGQRHRTAWVFRGEQPTLGTAIGGCCSSSASSSRPSPRRRRPRPERDGLVSKPTEAFTG
jgi:O-acetylserine/cysteine efflux transporter